MPTVRTRMQPGVPMDVSHEEASVLASMGLLADEPAPDAAPANTADQKAPKADQPPVETPEPTTEASETGAEATTTKKKG